MQLPKEFKLFGSTINVSFKNKDNNEGERYGAFQYSKCEITLSTTQLLDKLAEDRIKDTFYHEKVHAILDFMSEKELSENEKFVDIFGKLLRQSDETSIWEDVEKINGYKEIF
jgi:hypothetical protein